MKQLFCKDLFLQRLAMAGRARRQQSNGQFSAILNGVARLLGVCT